jgi:hypothetical protein
MMEQGPKKISKAKVIVLLVVVQLGLVLTQTDPNTYQVTESSLYRLTGCSKSVAISSDGFFVCISTENTSSLAAANSAGLIRKQELGLFSPPKSQKTANAKEISCYRNQNICVVLWNQHLEWFSVGITLTFMAEFQTKGFEYSALQVVHNTSYILFGGQTSESSPVFLRINRLVLSTYAQGVLGQVSGIKGPVSNIHLIRFTRWILMAEKETRRISIGDITTM